jgi:CheY-like chemotaxis protein
VAGTSVPTSSVRVVVIDDSAFQCSALRLLMRERFGDRVVVETFTNPRAALDRLDPAIDVLLLDWEMPGLDGASVLEEARRRGVDLKRVVIRSSYPADVLHAHFDDRGCLAVIEKGHHEQQAAFLMILDALVKRAERRSQNGEQTRGQ